MACCDLRLAAVGTQAGRRTIVWRRPRKSSMMTSDASPTAWASSATSASKSVLATMVWVSAIISARISMNCPSLQPASREPLQARGRHDLPVGGDALPVKRGLNEPALAQPEVALGEEQALAQEGSKQANAGTLDEVPASRHQSTSSMASGW